MKQLIKLYIKHSRVKKLNNYRYNQKVFENNFLNSFWLFCMIVFIFESKYWGTRVEVNDTSI